MDMPANTSLLIYRDGRLWREIPCDEKTGRLEKMYTAKDGDQLFWKYPVNVGNSVAMTPPITKDS